MSNPGERHLCDATQIDEMVSTMADRMLETTTAGIPFLLVGIRTRGVVLAERLAAEMLRTTGREVPVGAVDITLYRDDVGRSQTWPVLHGTEIPFSIEGADVVLVDDVLFTGRTVRAALNAICDLGRPSSVQLAVLVDRGHRELPIRADFVGLELKTVRSEHVRVLLRPHDAVDEVVSIGSAHGPSSQAPAPPADGRPET